MFDKTDKSNEELVVMAGSMARLLSPAIQGVVYGGQTGQTTEVDGDRILTKIHGTIGIDFSGPLRKVIEEEILPEAVALWELSEGKGIRTVVEQMFGDDVLAVVKKGAFPALPEPEEPEEELIPDNVRKIFTPRRHP